MQLCKMSNEVVVLVSLILSCILHSDATKCLKDDTVSEIYVTNVYYCEDPDEPQCCERDNEATCCEESSEKSLKNQFELWGILGVVVVAVAFVLVCWRKDTYMCEGNTMKERCSNCCNCKKKKSNDEDECAVELTVIDKETEGFTRSRNVPDRRFSAVREGTTVTSRGIEPIFTSQNDLHTSDVDSGRGSVTSSSPPLSSAANQRSRNSETDFSSSSGHAIAFVSGRTTSSSPIDGDDDMSAVQNSKSSKKDKKKGKLKKRKSKRSNKKDRRKSQDSQSEGIEISELPV